MENSFFEYRDHTGAGSESDSEIIDSSFSQSFVPKTPGKKNHTVYVPESDDSTEDESEKENEAPDLSKSVARRSNVKLHHVVLSSDDDKPSRGSIQTQSESSNKVLITSSDDEVHQVSPEIIPKRRPLVKPSPRSSDSFIGRKKKKHMILIDSESDNSFIKDHARKKKCLKDTPVKIDTVQKNIIRNIQNMSIQNDSIIDDDDDGKQSDQNDESQHSGDDDRSSREVSDDSQNSDDSNKSDYETASQDSDSDASGYEVSDSDHKNDDGNHKSEVNKKQGHKNKDLSHELNGKKNESDLIDDHDTSLNEVTDSDNNNCPKNKHSVKKQSDQSDAIEPSINEGDITEQNDIESSGRKESGSSNENEDETSSSGKKDSVTSDDGLEEEKMMMSRATRMSIMGIIPKENDSDDSDYIESDDTAQSSRAGSTGNLYIPDIEAHANTTPEKTTIIDDGDSSRITCSPISSPLHDVTNEINNSVNKNDEINSSLNKKDAKVSHINLYSPEVCDLKDKILKKVNKEAKMYKENVVDDDVTIIDKEPEIIALSSDDEVEVKEDKSPNLKKSPSVKKSPDVKKPQQSKEESSMQHISNIKQYLAPPSYPNQNIVYVKKHVRENELSKLNGLREDLQNVRYLLENMDVDTLPDGGAKLMERLNKLERDVQEQGDKVANMIVEPDMPTPQQMTQDGFAENKGLSWEDIQKASNAVQPRMFGKQAMATHMAERNLILDRLRDLYESLASRPSEDSLATQPASVKSELMEHQLHALAWLKWRETQKPSGGILADDMGLGKTITMISLIAADKEGSLDNDDDDDDERGPRSTRGGTLVVCPATLVQQWANEVGKHCTPHALSVCLHHGPARSTQPQRLATNDLVITTYNIMQRESVRGVLSRVRWRRVILDEAHVVRNHKSATSQGVCSLHARRRWALTGTPLHNKDLDLFALLKFLRCTPFDDLTMWKKWIDNKSLGGSERLNTIMSCVMLRRTKLQLQEKGQLTCLPERSTHDVSVTLQQEEMNVYQKVRYNSKSLCDSERLNTIMSCVMLRRTKLQLQEKGQLTCLPERSTHDVSVTLQQEEMNVYQKVRYNSKSLCDSERLNTIMSCVMLRRTKLQLQEKGQLTCLPERSTHDVSVTLQQEEMNVYQKVRYNSKSLCDSERLNTIMSCVMLRRTKLQLQEKGLLTCLPERSTHDI
ncbi:transcription termination factor 2-like [Maniola jurtina]|uniref:transcription termination factor 2-like n=1 Tax=Maniola jurtina TaxID=191418 RepID=UPI001E68BEFF|nr:transcription termination factor 2-like [Maniola jurtina]